MSGGSFNYLCNKDAESICGEFEMMALMVETLKTYPKTEAALALTEDIISSTKALQSMKDQLDDKLNRIHSVWRAVEWRESNDISVQDVNKIIDEFNVSDEFVPHFKNGTITFAMIKPDATERALEEEMINYIIHSGFTVLRRKECVLTKAQAEWLYAEHSDKDWFPHQIAYVTSGKVVMLALTSPYPAATTFRILMGPTDHTKAHPETLRGKYARSYRENSIHGSDGRESAQREIEKFFCS